MTMITQNISQETQLPLLRHPKKRPIHNDFTNKQPRYINLLLKQTTENIFFWWEIIFLNTNIEFYLILKKAKNKKNSIVLESFSTRQKWRRCFLSFFKWNVFSKKIMFFAILFLALFSLATGLLNCFFELNLNLFSWYLQAVINYYLPKCTWVALWWKRHSKLKSFTDKIDLFELEIVEEGRNGPL